MERDLEERSKRRKADKLKAEDFKIKGNDFLKNGDYKKAVEMYTEGLELKKDYKILYTNRALAYIKLKKFSKAVADCTRVLEYCDVFEKGY
jgi:tetratricopeptide (TPR) repeat protein